MERSSWSCAQKLDSCLPREIGDERVWALLGGLATSTNSRGPNEGKRQGDFTMTSHSDDDRDIDADSTLKIEALDETRLCALDSPFESDDPTSSKLSPELEAALCRLTPNAPGGGLRRSSGRPRQRSG
jgi:hypothetical protein